MTLTPLSLKLWMFLPHGLYDGWMFEKCTFVKIIVYISENIHVCMGNCLANDEIVFIKLFEL